MARVLNVEKFITDVLQRPAIWNRNYHCNKAFMEETWDELSIRHGLPVVTLKAKWKGLRDNFRVEYKRIPRDEHTGQMLISPDEHESKWVHYKALTFLVEHMRHRTTKMEGGGLSSKLEPFYYSDSIDYDDSSAPSPLPVQTELLSSPTPPNSSTPMRRNHEGLLEIPDHHDMSGIQPTISLNGVAPINMAKICPSKPRVITGVKRQRDELDSYSINDGSINNHNTHNSNNNHHLHNSNGIVNDEHQPIVTPKDDDYHFLMSMHPYFNALGPQQKLKVRMKMQKLVFKELYECNQNKEENGTENPIK